ncbi:unnamed protein product [Soboliphyme baturini]|uniref:SH3 domain-binding protein 5-like n=1 Tax=Soboliphyme baturini TaxID=241478 RepID=A0A183II70_9BILA|nr:unnamed protein product [Soboliphyme baturini]
MTTNFYGAKKSASSDDVYDMNRVHEELEKLNIATDIINKMEVQLDEAQAVFREVQMTWTQRLTQMAKRLGGCIEKSRPYYEARIKVSQQNAQKSALRFERANSLHAVAKQQVMLTQESLNRQGTSNVDPACLEVLNHHIQRVNEAEKERVQSEQQHVQMSRLVEQATKEVSAIQKSKHYFDMRVEFMKVLQNQKALIERLQEEIRQKKLDYNTSLHNLEHISEQIHELRNAGESSEDTLPCDPFISVSQPNTESSSMNSRNSSIRAQGDDDSCSLQRAINSGVILLAQELASRYSVSPHELFAFQFPPEDLDMEYRTAPEGISSSSSSEVKASKNSWSSSRRSSSDISTTSAGCRPVSLQLPSDVTVQAVKNSMAEHKADVAEPS